MSENWKCPGCQAPVDDLRYSVSTSGTEYGTAMLTDVNEEDDRITDHEFSDTGDTNWEGDTAEYECPHCDRSIDPSELIWIGKGADESNVKPKEPEDEELSHKIIKPEEEILDNSNRTDQAIESSIICSQCFHVIVCDKDELTHGYRGYGRQRNNNEPDEFFIECTKCNHINSTIEFDKLLKEGYFNKKSKKYANANNKSKNKSRSKSTKR